MPKAIYKNPNIQPTYFYKVVTSSNNSNKEIFMTESLARSVGRDNYGKYNYKKTWKIVRFQINKQNNKRGYVK